MSQKKNATIAGIQQIGIGVRNAKEAFDWYRRHFGMDIPIFEEAAEATVEADQKVHDELIKKDEKKHEKFKKIVDDAMKELERASKGV